MIIKLFLVLVLLFCGCEAPWEDDSMNDNEADVEIVKLLSQNHEEYIYNGRNSSGSKNDTIDGPIVNRGGATNSVNNTSPAAQ